jgi:hypothetical protein
VVRLGPEGWRLIRVARRTEAYVGLAKIAKLVERSGHKNITVVRQRRKGERKRVACMQGGRRVALRDVRWMCGDIRQDGGLMTDRVCCMVYGTWCACVCACVRVCVSE